MVRPRTHPGDAVVQWRGRAAWTFASDDTFASALDLSGEAAPPSVRIVLAYLDDDPLEVTRSLDALTPVPDPSVETTLFSGPLHAITPWEWGWFD